MFSFSLKASIFITCISFIVLINTFLPVILVTNCSKIQKVNKMPRQPILPLETSSEFQGQRNFCIWSAGRCTYLHFVGKKTRASLERCFLCLQVPPCGSNLLLEFYKVTCNLINCLLVPNEGGMALLAYFYPSV